MVEEKCVRDNSVQNAQAVHLSNSPVHLHWLTRRVHFGICLILGIGNQNIVPHGKMNALRLPRPILLEQLRRRVQVLATGFDGTWLGKRVC